MQVDTFDMVTMKDFVFPIEYHKRTDGVEAPSGRQTCGECREPIPDNDDRFLCNVNGCTELFCVLCFDVAPVCFACRRHVCEKHIANIGGLEICSECAGDDTVLSRLILRMEASLKAEEERHIVNIDRLGRRIDGLLGQQDVLRKGAKRG
jgi:hypothetical protein